MIEDKNPQNQELKEIYSNSLITVEIYGLERTIVPSENKKEKLWLFEGYVAYILTAANPKSEQLSEEENIKRNQLLEQDFVPLDPIQQVKTYGHDVEKTWVEQGYLLAGVSEQEVLQLATKYEQNAIYKLTPDELEVLPVLLEDCYSVSGWDWQIPK